VTAGPQRQGPVVPLKIITESGRKASSRLFDYRKKQNDDRKQIEQKHQELHNKSMGALTKAVLSKKKEREQMIRQSISKDR
jgi:hypothetical protein